ncbi:hypothetical protein PCASD_04835 [Puccinia coronata f. sp. avenae]|uniref:DNA-directed RNA polymerase n=1 Tax=Puccinia coronata f. sp. avenae TaxID=200324 RepID=A0A2N5V229_9BASI|nr:hypothetical protein PCASD_04835 [Puccinia coronata f. sp. avenae]
MKQIVLQEAPQKIKHIQFSVLSSQEIVALSEYESTQRDLYSMVSAEPNALSIPGVLEPVVKKPAKGGVLDSRLGTSDKSGTCGTCNAKMADCVGHYSYIKLILPVFHIGYFRAVIQMLQDVCKNDSQACARVLLSEEDRRLYLIKFRRPNLENLQRQHLAKQVNTACRKVLACRGSEGHRLVWTHRQKTKLFMLGWKYLMIPLLSPDTSQAPDFDQSRARTAVSCA